MEISEKFRDAWLQRREKYRIITNGCVYHVQYFGTGRALLGWGWQTPADWRTIHRYAGEDSDFGPEEFKTKEDAELFIKERVDKYLKDNLPFEVVG